MAVALEQFVKQLEDSGVISAGNLKSFIPPAASPKDAQELARQLVLSKQLTKFQVQEIYQGRAKSLIFGNYTILDKIGAGGMGQVFKAEHRRMHRVVAIKMLPNAVVKDPAAIARFQREVDAAAKLTHRNIVAAYDANEANGIHFLAMEYVEGIDLSVLIKKDGPLSVTKAVDYILQAARGLDFAHAEHVVHRDIKPANLLLDKKGTVKILDMGLARIETGVEAATQAELTNTGAVLGTIDYMAPEQGLSTKKADARADIYSLGCTLYYLLIGKPIYTGESVTAKLLAHHQQPVPDLRTLNKDVSDQLQRTFSKMVAKKVEDRFQTMSEIIAALESREESTFGQQTYVSAQQSVETTPNLDADALNFLNDVSTRSTLEPKSTTKPPAAAPVAIDGAAETKNLLSRKTILWSAAGVVGVAIVSGMFIALRTKPATPTGTRVGTLTIKIDQPGAAVQVLNEAGNVEITQPGGQGAVSISVDRGKHQVRVEKKGYKTFVQDFVMEPGGERNIKATLEPIITNATLNDPVFKKWTVYVGSMPPEQQVQAVVMELQRRNPGFDGQETHKIEDGVVREFRFLTEKVTDVAPVQAFAGLERLSFNGFNHFNEIKGKLSDLSPLQGMHLTWLDCGSTQVADLSPLAGMPLVTLACYFTPVSDLSPLQEMPLKVLHCDSTQIADLSPLKGMKLTTLTICHTSVSDVSVLKGMPLQKLSWDWTKIPAADIAAVTATFDRKPITTFSDPAFKQWARNVGALPADKQMQAVLQKWRELNPDFDGFEWHKIENGVVTEIEIQADGTTDISPLGALVGLKALRCYSASGVGDGRLADLSPLKGMRLQSLWLSGTRVSDLSPLAGTPLTELRIGNTLVSDLSPLRGMKLTTLWFDGTNIADLSPLKGMPLTFLGCSGTKVSDLSPLKGMKLTGLNFINTLVTDLSPLKGMPLTSLDCQAMPISDLRPLAGAPLTDFDCSRTEISDLSPLRGMPLTRLICNDTRIAELSPLRGMHLTTLNVVRTRVTDLSLLKGMPLTALWCDHLAVSDLSPLAGMPLNELHCENMPVSDLSTLRGMPLTFLECNDTKVTDFSPLSGLSLKTLLFTPKNIIAGMGAIRTMKSLERIGTASFRPSFPPDEFWEKYDTGYFLPWDKNPAFRKWMAEVAALPADKQVQAVAKKLQDLNPEYDGNETHQIENGVVVEFNFLSDRGQVWDISPVRALAGLKRLSCNGTNPHGASLFDLSPLAGMPLTNLNCGYSRVYDLSPLRGMPLAFLDCDGTYVYDLAPLRGMPLARLFAAGTEISDLTPLHGSPLTDLSIANTPVSNLSPLKGINLSIFRCNGTRVPPAIVAALQRAMPKCRIDWPLEGVVFSEPMAIQLDAVLKKLQELNPGFNGNALVRVENGTVTELTINTDKVTDLSPVRALSGLKGLDCSGSYPNLGKLSDLSPLKGLSLTSLHCHDTRVADLSPLKGMPLTYLECYLTRVSDLSPLKGMPLTSLDIGGTPVPDLSLLRGMPLVRLLCGGTRIADLSPLKGMPLNYFACNESRVSDLSPLAETNLTDFYFTPKNVTAGIDVIRQMQSLKTIGIDGDNKFPAADFWKKYDAGEFGK